MAVSSGVTLPDGAWWQPGETEGINEKGQRTRTFVAKGLYNGLADVLKDLKRGDTVADGWSLTSGNLARGNGGTGVLTLVCAAASDGDDEDGALDETWTVKSVRNDMSIFSYCGQGGNNPSRERIEAWQKEPDASVAENNMYTKPDGTLAELTSADVTLIGKMRLGIDSVMRFYPMLTKTRTYTAQPANVMENLSHIDVPAAGSGGNVKVPGNLGAIIGRYMWLKCQDDCEEQPDGMFKRVESWIGAEEWDQNLYGGAGVRWGMPYEH